MKKIRVAFFAEILTENFDGAVRTMYQLINRIDRSKFEFLFIYGAGPDQVEDFDCLKIPSVVLPVNSSYSMALPVLAQTRLKKKLRDFAADIVHIATPSLLGNFGLNYAVQNHLPVITIYHTHFISYIDYYLKHTPFLINSIKERLLLNHKAFYNRCDKVYVPSTTIKEELTEIGIDPAKMDLWRRGINTAMFSPDKKNKALMRSLTGNDNPSVLFASRLVWEKNLETLFEIYDGMQQAAPDVNFVIAGDGIARQQCEERMPNAVFTGNVNHHDLAVMYASSDVFVFPSMSEAYGNVVLEAMSSGLPCVIADGGGSRDFIAQGINGFRCRPNDASAYVKKINLILNDTLLKEHLVLAGINYSSTFNWEQLAATYFNDLGELARRYMLATA